MAYTKAEALERQWKESVARIEALADEVVAEVLKKFETGEFNEKKFWREQRTVVSDPDDREEHDKVNHYIADRIMTEQGFSRIYQAISRRCQLTMVYDMIYDRRPKV